MWGGWITYAYYCDTYSYTSLATWRSSYGEDRSTTPLHGSIGPSTVGEWPALFDVKRSSWSGTTDRTLTGARGEEAESEVLRPDRENRSSRTPLTPASSSRFRQKREMCKIPLLVRPSLVRVPSLLRNHSSQGRPPSTPTLWSWYDIETWQAWAEGTGRRTHLDA